MCVYIHFLFLLLKQKYENMYIFNTEIDIAKEYILDTQALIKTIKRLFIAQLFITKYKR